MRGFDSEDSHKQFHYLLEHPRFSQRTMAKDLGWTHNEKISSFVGWLEELRFVQKTGETGKGKPRYFIPSKIELIEFYSRFRNMKKEEIAEVRIDMKKENVIKYISKNGGILCLTTALELFDEDYFRDPTVHAYVTDMKLMNNLKNMTEGETKVCLYSYKYPDLERSSEGIKKTSASRTIIDLFCNNMTYAAEQFIPKVWNK